MNGHDKIFETKAERCSSHEKSENHESKRDMKTGRKWRSVEQRLCKDLLKWMIRQMMMMSAWSTTWILLYNQLVSKQMSL